MAKTTLYERLTEARELLGLGEEATRSEIDLRVKNLLKRWHPDCCQDDDPARCTEMTRRIIEAAKLIRAYCANYRFSFLEDEVENYLSPEEWWEKRFGAAPLWASSESARSDALGGERPHGVRRRP